MKFLAVVGICAALVARVGWAEIEVSDGPARLPGASSSGTVPPKSTPPQPVAAVVDGDVLKFLNGDTLHGTVLGATPAGGLRWRRSDVKEPLTFDLRSVGEIALAPRVKSNMGQRTIVELTNGDALPGELAGLDEKTLTLKTWYAGTVAVKRALVERLTFVAEVPDASYTGPNSLEEWKADGNRNAWSFKRGALFSVGNGTLIRDVKLPDVANIEFELAWRGQLYANFGFGFDDATQIYRSGGYMVQLSHSTIYLQRYRANSGSNNMGSNVEMQELQRKTRVRVSLRVNKPKKTFALFLDGNLVKQWTEADEWVAKGPALVLMSQGQGQLRVSNIAVSTWDGRLDSEASTTAKEADLVRLNNGDKVSGMVKSIANGQIVLAASFAEMNVPLERVIAIELATAKSERARRNAADIQTFFPDGRRLTFALEKLDEQNFQGTSEACGRLTVAVAACRRARFQIYEKREEAGADDDWGGSVGAQLLDE